jgi:MFS family permease
MLCSEALLALSSVLCWSVLPGAWQCGQTFPSWLALIPCFVGLILASILIFSGLRPDPRDIGRQLSLMYPDTVPSKTDRSLLNIIGQPGVIVAMVSVVFAQMVMVVPMSITSVHMKAHDHPLGALSLVISAHTIGMFAFSIFSGRLTDKWGRPQVIVLGSVLLIISCLMAAPSTGIFALISALFVLGLGWNFTYVAGSALLSDLLSPGKRAKTQGFNDLLLNMASASGQFTSGVVYASHGYGVMANAAAAAALAPLVAALWWMVHRKVEAKH